MARETHAHLSSFDALEAFLGSKSSRKIKNNTTAVRRDADTIAVQLHGTDVVTFLREWEDVMTGRGYQRVQRDSVILNSGGWQSVTTKARMNEFLPARFGVTQDNYQWFIIDRNQPNPWDKSTRLAYRDGVTLELGERVLSGAICEELEENGTCIHSSHMARAGF